MKNAIFIEVGEQLTLKEYVPIASEAMSLIAEASKEVKEINETFSVTALAALLNKICVYMKGEFEVRRTPSGYLQIVYTPCIVNETEFEEGYRVDDIVEAPNHGQNTLWLSEKVVVAFIDRNLYGVAFMLYFYLGYLMTQDDAFGMSQNISFKQIIESCSEFPEEWRVKHPTTLMRALSDLQDAGLIKWNAKSRTFQLMDITPYDPNQKV